MDEIALVKRFQNGDHAAFNELAVRWQARIHRFAYGFFADADDAGEITQKTFVKVYQKRDTLDHPDNFPAWIYRVANNLCLDELKRAGRRKSSPLDAWQDDAGNGADAPTPADLMEAKELGAIIHRAMMTLPEEQRIVVILKEYDGLKFREIAGILDEPENTIKSRLYYGLKTLRKVLIKWKIPNEYLEK